MPYPFLRAFRDVLLAGMLLLLSSACIVQAQGPSAPIRRADAGSHISADNDPYHLEWDGKRGFFVRNAVGSLSEIRQPLVFLHTDPGPEGYARYLAWFLARDETGFTLIWCYLNDNGPDFYCWLYSYPSNQLINLRLQGKYTFSPPAEPAAGGEIPRFTPRSDAQYAGPDFKFRDWTRQSGLLPHLALTPASSGHSSSPAAKVASNGPVLEKLQFTPLQEVHVAGGNGWRSEGWRELHGLAYDGANDPYYLILYSNSSYGYAIDLKRAKIYFADFGDKVQFSTTTSVFGPTEDRLTGPPEVRVDRYSRYEIDLIAKEKYTNPYAQVLLWCDFHAPDGSQVTVPGFWDGGDRWIVRLAPTRAGDWTWKTRSSDAGLDKLEGTFTCVAETANKQGFLITNKTDIHSFTLSDGSPFLPAPIVFPIHPRSWRTDQSGALSPNLRMVGLASGEEATGDAGTPDLDFTREVDALADLGFNRFVGGFLLDQSVAVPASQGGRNPSLFVDGDPDRIDPAFFQELDRRLAYCNSKNIVPDIGLGQLGSAALSALDQVQRERFWRYVTARCSVYNICWNLLGRKIGSAMPEDADETEQDLADLTRKNDPVHHPITSMLPGRPEPTDPVLSSKPTMNSLLVKSGDLDGSYVISPAGLDLWPNPDHLLKAKAAAARVQQALTPGASVRWLDVITINGGTLQSVSSDLRYNRPIMIYDSTTPPTPDTPRYRLWETRMRGGYWADANVKEGKARPEDQTTQWAIFCNRLFLGTRYWRLAPHNEMLQPLREQKSSVQNTAPAPGAAMAVRVPGKAGAASPDAGVLPTFPPLPHPAKSLQPGEVGSGIFLLADPAWEYVIYFEHGGSAALDLLEATGSLTLNWFNPRTGKLSRQDHTMGGAHRQFTAPDDKDWVLYLRR